MRKSNAFEAHVSARGSLQSYIYLLVAVLIAIAFAIALGFALVSAIRHILWAYLMGHAASPLLWLETGLIVTVTLVFWYRIIASSLEQWQKQRYLRRELEPHLEPDREILQTVPVELRRIASWYLLQDDRCLAFTWGLRDRRIALSTGLLRLLDDKSQRAVMYHEAAHAMVYDPMQQTLLLILTHALKPLGIGLLYQRYLIRREILADRVALAACGGDDVPLISAIAAAVKGQRQGSQMPSYVGFTGGLESRLMFLQSGVTPQWWDARTRNRLYAISCAVTLTIAQGFLVWCH